MHIQKSLFIKKIRENFPKLKFSDSHLCTSGWDKTALILDDKIVFLFPKPGQRYRDKCTKEQALSPLLTQWVWVATPKFTHVPKDRSFEGCACIRGVPLTVSRFKKLTVQERQVIARQLGGFLKDLHRIPISLVKKCSVKEEISATQEEKQIRNEADVVKKRLSRHDRESMDAILKNTRTTRSYRKTLTHQDLSGSHILINQKNHTLTGVIDFGDAKIGDPADDFKKLWLFGEKFVDLVLHNYPAKDITLKKRSQDKFLRHGIELLYYGVTMRRKDLWRRGHAIMRSNVHIV